MRGGIDVIIKNTQKISNRLEYLSIQSNNTRIKKHSKDFKPTRVFIDFVEYRHIFLDRYSLHDRLK